MLAHLKRTVFIKQILKKKKKFSLNTFKEKVKRIAATKFPFLYTFDIFFHFLALQLWKTNARQPMSEHCSVQTNVKSIKELILFGSDIYMGICQLPTLCQPDQRLEDNLTPAPI